MHHIASRRREKIASVLLLTMTLIALGLGLAWLFEVRFRSGDVYPPYSSYRADPLGSRGFHDSLATLPGMNVQRNLGELSQIPTPSSTTLYWLGINSTHDATAPEQLVLDLESFVRRGGRLVLAWTSPNTTTATPIGSGSVSNPPPTAGPSPRPPGAAPPRTAAEPPPTADWGQRWAFSLKISGQAAREGSNHATRSPAGPTTDLTHILPKTINWPSPRVLANLGESWTSIYQLGDEVVVAERALGRGSVVICADAFPFSNQALRQDPQAALLYWTTGMRNQLIFDETHLGVTETVGVGTLARRYRLHGLFLGLLILAALWAWRSWVPLVPPPPNLTSLEETTMSGRDAASGLLALLHRNVPPPDLASACLDEWRRSFPDQRPPHALAGNMTTVVVREQNRPTRDQDPVQAYRDLEALAKARKRYGH